MVLNKKKKNSIISTCFESEEMREHLMEHADEITQRQWINIIRGAPIPIHAKADLLRDVDNPGYQEITAAIDALELKSDQFFLYSWIGYEKVGGGMEIVSDCIGPCRDLAIVREHLRKEMFDAPEGADLWEHRLETRYWVELELYEADDDGGFRNPYTYYLIADRVCYFEKNNKPDESGFYYRSVDMRYSWQTVHLNIDIPFHPGDIVTVDSRPFAGPKRVLITEVGSGCCGVQALYWNDSEEIWDTRALKHGGIYDEDMPMISPLYRVRRNAGSFEE